MDKILIYVDPCSPEASVGLLDAAARIAPEGELVSYAFCPGEPPPCIEGFFDYCIMMAEPIPAHDAANLSGCLESLQKQYDFDAVLLPATQWGRMLAPRAAMRMKAGLVADVTAVERGSDFVRLVRPAFDGKLLADIKCCGKKPLMASVRAGVFRYSGNNGKKTQRITFALRNPSPCGIKLLSAERKPAPADIRESEILVSGGGGVGESIGHLEPLAKALGGMVSASRRLVDSGIAPRSIQVGQSGKTVSPRLYFALGIYGSLQHIEGLREIECIISVNTNRYAPICSISNIVVEGDAIEFARKLENKIEQNRSCKPQY